MRNIQTMQELAEYVGFSRQTLSKYFNNPTLIGEQTRKTIEQALAETGFRPNILASNLKREKSKLIGVVIPSLTDPFFTQLVNRITKIADAEGYFTITLASHGRQRIEADAISQLQSLNAAGAIVVPLGAKGVQPTVRKVEKSFPLVYLDTPPCHQATFVGTDNAQSVQMMVRYLVESGSSPHFLAMPAVNRNAHARTKSYQQSMEALGLEPKVIFPSNKNHWQFEEEGYLRIKAWIEEMDFSSQQTLFCANDRLAFGALRAAWEKQISVGKNAMLRIAGHDNHPLTTYTCPPLTTIAQDDVLIAQTAVSALIEKIQQPDYIITRHIKAQLICRESA